LTAPDDPSSPPHTPGGLISAALGQLAAILRGELALARAEVSQAAGRAGAGLGLLVMAILMGIVALNLAAVALVAAVVHAGLPPHWANLVVCGGFFIAATVFAVVGLRALRSAGFVPDRALRGLQRDAETIADTMKSSSKEG